MGGHGVDDGVAFAVPAKQLDTQLEVCALQLAVYRFADVVQEGGTNRDMCVETQFPSHDAGQIGDFLRVRQAHSDRNSS